VLATWQWKATRLRSSSRPGSPTATRASAWPDPVSCALDCLRPSTARDHGAIKCYYALPCHIPVPLLDSPTTACCHHMLVGEGMEKTTSIFGRILSPRSQLDPRSGDSRRRLLTTRSQRSGTKTIAAHPLQNSPRVSGGGAEARRGGVLHSSLRQCM
jgi:hypothetical protein